MFRRDYLRDAFSATLLNTAIPASFWALIVI
jgi:hypothetical protein